MSCDFQNGVLLLRGRLRSFHHKQLAQETVRQLAGVGQIVNAIEVIDGQNHDFTGYRPAAIPAR